MTGFAIYKSKFGYIRISYEGEEIILLKKVHEQPKDFGRKTKLTDMVFSQVLEYFDGKRKSFDFTYKFYGTDFQKKVWTALCSIPYGKTCSYKDIAIKIGNPKACRAVGMANNKNPIAIVVPCHRVIGSSGKLVGYGGGLLMKEALLKLERENI